MVDAQYPSVSKEYPLKKSVITAELVRVTTTPANLVVQTVKAVVTRLQLENLVESMNMERAWTNMATLKHYLSAVLDSSVIAPVLFTNSSPRSSAGHCATFVPAPAVRSFG